MAEETIASSAGDNRACSDGRSREDKCSSGKRSRARTESGVLQRWDPYTIEVDRRRNCYACGGFGHIACHCRNRKRGRLMEEKRVEYSGGQIKEIFDNMNNLKEGENLELLD